MDEKDGWVVKIDSEGNNEWDEHYGGSGNEVFHFIDQTGDGEYVILGYTGSFGGKDRIWYLKIDDKGETKQNKTFGGEFGGFKDAIKTEDEGYALTGWYDKEGDGTTNSWLIKTDTSGEVEWNQIYSDSSEYLATSLIQTSDGGYAISGRIEKSKDDEDNFWLMKADSSGEKKWSSSMGGMNTDKAWDLIQTDGGEYLMVGITYSFGASPYTDLLLLKADSSGREIWNKTYGGEKGYCGYSIIRTEDGGFATAGKINYHDDFYILKYEDETTQGDDGGEQNVDENGDNIPFFTSGKFLIIILLVSLVTEIKKQENN